MAVAASEGTVVVADSIGGIRTFRIDTLP